MMTIGEFAQLTGLSVKALRLYDEQKLLEPARVDRWSGYRRYTAEQLLPAIRLNALRQAGMSLAEAARVLVHAEPAEVVLDEHRDRLAAERRTQDAALATAAALFADDRPAWQVTERTTAAQPWAGAVLPIDDETDDEAANEAFGGLWRALSADGNPPAGQPWSMFRAEPDGSAAELVCCWPVARQPPAGWRPGVVSGEVPAGPELVVHWRHSDDAATVDGAVHPAVLALIVEAERRGITIELSHLRQIVVEDGVEVAIGAP